MNEFQTDDKIDQMLRRHFQSEMPSPWPAFVVPRSARPFRPTRTWLGRFAVAACVALLFLGYWSLSQWFPDPGTTEEGIVQEGHIASKPKVTEKLATPSKNGENSEDGMGRMEKVPLP